MIRIFISYAREDLEIASGVFDDLETAGFQPWLDKKCLLPGERWEIAIRQAIENAHYFIALLSSGSVSKKGYVQKELRLAMDVLDTIPEDKIFIIPARLDDCMPSHQRLKELNWVDLFPDASLGIRQIVRSLHFAPENIFLDSLIGTIWTFKDRENYHFELLADGVMKRYKGAPFSNASDARWRQSGTTIYFEVNDNYAQYKGTISNNGKQMSGTAQNKNGKYWDWSAELVDG